MDIKTIPTHSRVRLMIGDLPLEGLLLPQEGEMFVVKLSSGYNVGVHPKKITDVQLLERPNPRTQEKPELEQNTDLPNIRILHTGGTIASRVDYETGGVIADFEPETILSMFPELSKIARVESTFLGNMWSDDLRFSHINTIAKSAFEAAQEGVTKLIVTSGTDFLHYLSAGLSFVLANLPISVLVVGSQRSSDRGSSDAAMNLVCAAQFLATTEFQGVGVCMHGSVNDDHCVILPGVNARKMHSSRRDAFKPINTAMIATVDYANKTIVFHRKLTTSSSSSLTQPLSLYKEDLRVGMILSRPNLFAQELNAYSSCDGVVLVGSGLGHFPVSAVDEDSKEHEHIFESIKSLCDKMPVVMSTQALYGRVHMNVYAPARKLQDIGVLGHSSSMTPETTYMKLSWLLSTQVKEKIPELLSQNLVGELDQIYVDEFY